MTGPTKPTERRPKPASTAPSPTPGGDNSCSSSRTKPKTLVARLLPWTPATPLSGARAAGTLPKRAGSPRPGFDVRRVDMRPTPTSTPPPTSCGPVGPDRLRPVQVHRQNDPLPHVLHQIWRSLLLLAHERFDVWSPHLGEM